MSSSTGDAAAAPYLSRVTVRRAGGPDKAVTLPGEETEVVMGSHPALAPHIGAPQEHPAHASTLDYVVGATAACLAGTLARALAVRGVEVAPADHEVEGVGHFTRRDGVLAIERIAVTHRLRLPAAQHDVARRVHGFHHRGCPVSRSLEGAIEITTELRLV